VQACVVALALALAGCASIEPPPATETSAVEPHPQPTTPAVSPERARLVEAFGGEYSSPSAKRFLDDVLVKLANASGSPSEPYRVTLLDSPIVNAFALPSGDIFITRGLLALANDGSEVAAVMAHEIGHVTAHHAAQRAELERRAALFKRVSTQVLDKPGQGEEEAARMQLSIAHFSREQEFEADKIGIAVIAKAGYDPYAASRFLESLGRWSAFRAKLIGSGSNDKPDMTATHPSTPERIAAAVAQAKQIAPPGVGETARNAYLSAIDGVSFGDNPAQGLVLGRRFLHPKLGFGFEAPDGFSLENQSAALVGVGEAGSQALRLDSIEANDSTTLEAALASGWIEGVQTASIETLKDTELPTAVAIAQGREWSFRLAAIRLNGRIYRLIFAAHTLPAAVDQRFLASIRSFHRMTPGEASEARASRLQIVAARDGDTPQTFGDQMAVAPDPLEQFVILNGLEKTSTTPAGERFKIVTR
jgi:predicted Zn-dependent protease